ncbi:MAG TPA: dienelactone hydrolase family protein [Anaerohalosphaeraceae bacterium]|nr:dienelactone hydrolase family protein [Anaerohalosphaeraceae bacterium]HRT52031.1 dienelactone hydrolase family protein [Anaerohalosphaeraceae bacterium]HRT88107.1 dienelactone hydrolase family protein [Anaerohalosphaeraceae bacterium]
MDTAEPCMDAVRLPVNSASEWDALKPALRATLWRLLGELPEPFVPEPMIHSRSDRGRYILERFSFDNRAGATVYGYAMIPKRGDPPYPSILYHHYHGGRYAQGKEEIRKRAFARWRRGHGLITGEELTGRGYLVLCIDAYAFGERRCCGPAGAKERPPHTEASLFKAFLWQGATLWGMMVRDDLLALNHLASRPEVDPSRIAAMGMSMGATRSWWLAALDDRIKVTVSVACLTRYQDLLRQGLLKEHGIYYYVPGMLRHNMHIEKVVGLIAPRAHLTLTGDSDSGSPVEGVRIINEFQRRLYALYGSDNFRGLIYEGVGHTYTSQMWTETIDWLKLKL